MGQLFFVVIMFIVLCAPLLLLTLVVAVLSMLGVKRCKMAPRYIAAMFVMAAFPMVVRGTPLILRWVWMRFL